MPHTILGVENSIWNVSSGEDSYENKYGKHYNRSMCKMPYKHKGEAVILLEKSWTGIESQ